MNPISPLANSVHSTIRSRENFNRERLVSRKPLLFGLLALVLASVGPYRITAYSVARRTSEIGVRMQRRG